MSLHPYKVSVSICQQTRTLIWLLSLSAIFVPFCEIFFLIYADVPHINNNDTFFRFISTFIKIESSTKDEEYSSKNTIDESPLKNITSTSTYEGSEGTAKVADEEAYALEGEVGKEPWSSATQTTDQEEQTAQV